MLRRGRAKRELTGGPFEGLRRMALTDSTPVVGATASPDSDLIGVVVDIPAEGGYATLVALLDGTTSLYTSTGGGVIGAGAHEAVASANRLLLNVLTEQAHLFPADERTDLPTTGLVQVTLLTRKGRHRASIESRAFWGEIPSTIPVIIGAIQDVLTAIRETSPS